MIIMSTRKMTQEERVLDYMQRYGGIQIRKQGTS